MHPKSTKTPSGSPGRRRPSAARARILATADRLFYDNGIRAVGVHRVVEEAEVTRVTLYRHFPSKDDLVQAYLMDRAAENERLITAIIDQHPDDPRQALRAMCELVAAGGFATEYRGCAFINAAAEHGDRDHPARTVVTRHRQWVTAAMAGLLEQAGHPTAAATAEMLMMLRTGAVVSAALDDADDVDVNFLRACALLLDATLAPPGQVRAES